jgi:predicted permease
MLQDFKLGLKLLRKDAAYTATAVLTLALCIGANTAIFTIVRSVLLKPLPVPDSDRIVLMANQYPNAGSSSAAGVNSGAPDYYDRLQAMTVYDEQAMYTYTNRAFDLDGTPEMARGMAVTPSLFRLLEVPPAHGRIFDESEGEVGNDQKVVLSHGFAQQLVGGDPAAIGRTIPVAGRPHTIVGIMPPSFLFADPEMRFWIPLAFTAEQKSDDARHSNNWYNVGRLKPGATVAQAQAQVNALNAANLERFPQFREILVNAGFHTTVTPLQDVFVGSFRPTLFLLWGGALFVLLIGAVNIANLAFARSSLRAKELATRLALGAGHLRVARQLIVESLVLAFVGGLAGIGVGAAVLQAHSVIGLDRLPRATEIRMDATTILVAIALSAVVGVFIGLVSGTQIVRGGLHDRLREEGRSGTGGRRSVATRRGLVVAQIAFAFVLLIGSGLLLVSFRNLLAVDPGFTSRGVVTAFIGTGTARYPTDTHVRSFVTRLTDAVRAIPGVTDVGGSTSLPMSGFRSDSVILAEGYRMRPGESLISPNQVFVTPGYFEAMRTRLLQGRFFDDRDDDKATPVVIVDERLARRFWSDESPLGKRMYQPSNPRDLLSVDEKTRFLTVVGVVSEVRLADLAGRAGSVGAYYFPAAQRATRTLGLAIRTQTDPGAVIQAVRNELKKIDPTMPLVDVKTMEERVQLSLVPRRAAMLLALAFGAVALLLSGIGVYGVLAYLVSQRIREIGIRIALGSSARDIFTLVIREGALLVGGGFAVGIAGLTVLGRVMESQVFGISTMEPTVVGVVIVLFGAIALAACAVPALRATRVDPIVVLNQA